MPLSSFLIVVAGFVGLVGVFLPFLFGIRGSPQDEASRSFIWIIIVSLPLLLAPAVSIVRLKKLTRNMAIFATACAALLALLLLWTGLPEIASFKVGWVVGFLAALTMAAGGGMAINDPPDESW